jgi:hypothetical protein
MPSEREARSSPPVPNPLSARIAALVCLALAVFALLLAVIGVLVLGAFPRDLVDGLILMLGGAFFTVFFFILARGFHTMAKHDQRARRLASGRCPRCDYDIRNLPDCRCPECGATWSADEVKGR